MRGGPAPVDTPSNRFSGCLVAKIAAANASSVLLPALEFAESFDFHHIARMRPVFLWRWRRQGPRRRPAFNLNIILDSAALRCYSGARRVPSTEPNSPVRRRDYRHLGSCALTKLEFGERARGYSGVNHVAYTEISRNVEPVFVSAATLS